VPLGKDVYFKLSLADLEDIWSPPLLMAVFISTLLIPSMSPRSVLRLDSTSTKSEWNVVATVWQQSAVTLETAGVSLVVGSMRSLGEIISVSAGEFSSSNGCLNNQFPGLRVFLQLLVMLSLLPALLVLLLPSKLLFLERFASYRSPYYTSSIEEEAELSLSGEHHHSLHHTQSSLSEVEHNRPFTGRGTFLSCIRPTNAFKGPHGDSTAQRS
jgi:hypothetical protein